MGKRIASAIASIAVTVVIVTGVASINNSEGFFDPVRDSIVEPVSNFIGNIGGKSHANPPKAPAAPSFPSAGASSDQIAKYERDYANYLDKMTAYGKDYREYEDYWAGHERGYAHGRRMTCDGIDTILSGSSPSKARYEIDTYYDALPTDEVREKGYADGFKEGREYINNALDSDEATLFDLMFVCS